MEVEINIPQTALSTLRSVKTKQESTNTVLLQATLIVAKYDTHTQLPYAIQKTIAASESDNGIISGPLCSKFNANWLF